MRIVQAICTVKAPGRSITLRDCCDAQDRSWPTTGISELPIDAANALVFTMREMYN